MSHDARRSHPPDWVRRLAALALSGLLAGLWPPPGAAAPFAPADDAQVLERVRARAADPAARDVRRLRAELEAQPRDLPAALRLARRYLELGRAESDPRYYGYAQAALAPWWHLDEPPAAVLTLRAIIRQSGHDFEPALRDLTRVVRQDPGNAQAWVTRALILQVRGEYAEAKRNCLRLMGLAAQLAAVTCLSGVGSLSGQAQPSYQLLLRVVAEAPDAPPRERLWALTVLADIAARRGDVAAAERHFREALALGLRDAHLLGLYADFLLDQRRPAEVAALLRNETRPDAMLLRLALAERALGAPALAEHVEALEARFAASRLRGDARHRREEARFRLQLVGQPRAALQLARDNWAVQRESEDARILLEAALAAGDATAAKPALDWLEKGVEDVHLARLARDLRSAKR